MIKKNETIRAQGAHNQFVASALTVKAAKEIDENIMVGMMLLIDHHILIIQIQRNRSNV